MEIVLATRNADKVREIKAILEGLCVKIVTFRELSKVPVVEEDGRTLEENAIKKASIWGRETDKIALADDSGLEVDYLGGEPGVYSSRFAGENVSYADNNAKLLRLLEGVEWERRTARFRCIAALVFPEGKRELFEGTVDGFITTRPRGEAGFGYDPVFFLPEYGKTFAELGEEIKNKISHRAIAFGKLKRYFEKYRDT